MTRSAEPRVATFRRRALAEAERYGGDPWVFVRELLQNARDAGAHRVVFRTSDAGSGLQRLVCRDDGEGMSLADARRYLFTLYASSKDADATQAGRFGIGFWAVLRFRPKRLAVRSAAARAEPWEILFDGELRASSATPARLERGTEVELERRPPPSETLADLGSAVATAARRYGRFLRRRDDPTTALDIEVDGERINAEFNLPAPAARFHRPGLRGVVALAAEPAVELFAKGLYVRSAAALGDLRTADRQSSDPGLPEGVAPRVLLDSDQLDVLLQRRDARDGPHLRRLVKTAQSELRRLVRRQLQASSPRSWPRRAADALAARLSRVPRSAWVAAALVLGIAAGWALARGGRSVDPRHPTEPTRRAAVARDAPVTGARTVAERSTTRRPAALSGSAPAPDRHRYRDLSGRYAGPQLDPLRRDGPAVDLRYAPTDLRLYFNALVLDETTGAGPDRERHRSQVASRRYPCTAGCVEIELAVDAGAGDLRLPVPAGHAIDAASMKLSGGTVELRVDRAGDPVLRFGTPTVGRLTYRTGRAPTPEGYRPPRPTEPPRGLLEIAARLRGQTFVDRLQGALDWTAERVRYDRGDDAIASYRDLREAGNSVVDAALAIGAGDCDVQNAVLAELLRALGIDARVAIGYAGRDGAALPGLHAWVELRDPQGGWLTADASASLPARQRSATPPPASRRVGQLPALLPSAAADVEASHPAESTAWANAMARSLPRPESPVAGLTLPAFSGRTVALVSAALLLVAAFVAVGRQARTGHDIAVAPEVDVATLLAGALRRPRAFAALPTLEHGRLVPCLGGRRLSIHRARGRARRGRLYVGRSTWARETAASAARRAIVLDAAEPAARVVAEALGAIDLDRWGRLVEAGIETPLTRRLDEVLGRRRDPRVRVAPDLERGLVEVDLAALGVGRPRLFVAAAELEDADALLAQRPRQAVFVALDRLSDEVEGIGRRHLARAAADALAEAAGR